MNTFLNYYSALRQKAFPPAFRIDSRNSDDWPPALARTLRELLQVLNTRPAMPPVPEPARDNGPALTPDFVVSLCNYYFRLNRNAAQMEREGLNSKELRSIKLALENIERLFKKQGIECRDLTGQAYDFGRLDFEQIGPASPVPGLDRLRIGRCERPAIMLGGQLIQKAKGLVDRPA
jgi:hypothetical protein